jgi:hypothetical protein
LIKATCAHALCPVSQTAEQFRRQEFAEFRHVRHQGGEKYCVETTLHWVNTVLL